MDRSELGPGGTRGGGEITATVVGGIATVRISNPRKRNAMTYRMWEELAANCRRLAADRSVRLLVVRGAGDHFCAGADIEGLVDHSAADYQVANEDAERSLAAVPVPTVAFVTGSCVGGGTQIALACDLRIADTTARFGITPSRLGIVYPAFAVERAVRILGPSVTKFLLFSGELVEAGRASELGLVDELHATDAAEDRLAELVGTLAHERSLLSQAAAKSMVDAVTRTGRVPDELERTWMAEEEAGSDRSEGIASFLGHRAPNFTWSPPGVQGTDPDRLPPPT